MNFLSSLSSAVLSASSAALQNATSTGIPGVNGYTLGERITDYDGKSIWTLYTGIKRDDQSQVSIFQFETNSQGQGDRRQLLPLAKNSFRKLRSTRHPNILKFLDGSESDQSVWIITELVEPLSFQLELMSEESKVYGLLHLVTALGFLNTSGTVHGGVRKETIWVTKGGEYKLGGFEVASKLDETDGVMWNFGGLLPDSRYHASPEVRKGGWTSLKEYDPSTYDSYLLHLLIFQLFNGPLPNSYLSPSSSSSETPSLPQTRGSIPQPLFQPWRRLGNPNPLARLKTSAFLELGNSTNDSIGGSGGGWWTNNRLVRLSTALEGFPLASENEKATLIRTLKAISSSQTTTTPPSSTIPQLNGTSPTSTSTSPLPTGFLLYKILPSLLHTFEFSSSSSSSLLPLILSLSTPLSPTEYSTRIIPPLLRMFQVPDRAMRMALLEGLEVYGDKLNSKEVVEKVWPYLVTGFGDLVPVIREATVKSILIIAPKLNDRILNNDLLRYLSKTQTDSEPGIRTNTCILLSRLSPHLSLSTQRKVLIPAFARSLRDPFVHARIAGLMSLMAGLEGWEKEDLAGKVIPSIGICLVDKEKSVRDQGYRAIEMFVRKCEQLTASMPETAISPELPSSQAVVYGTTVPSTQSIGLATNAAGAAGALASWGFASISKKLSSAELATPIERRVSTPQLVPSSPAPPPPPQASTSTSTSTSVGQTPSLQVPGGFAFDSSASVGGTTAVKEDWGGDLMDVNDDTEDWDEFETGQPQTSKTRIDPLAARLSATKQTSTLAGGGKKGSMRLGGASKSSALRVPMDMDATDSWELDLNESPAASIKGVKPKPAPSLPPQSQSSTTIPRVSAPSSRSTPIHSRTPSNVASPSARSIPPPTIAVPPPLSQTSIPAPLRSPLPPLSTPPLAPIAPSTSTVPSPLPIPTEPVIPISPPPESRSSTPALPASPALSAASAVPTAAVLSKEEKAAKMAAAREERRKRMAAAKGK